MQYDNISQKRPPGGSSTMGIDPDELAGAVSARREFGPDAEQAVITAFLERTGHAIDARVDQRVAQHRVAGAWGGYPGRDSGPGTGAKVTLALGSLVMAIPLTGIATQMNAVVALITVLITWAAIVAVNISFHRSRPR